MTPVVGRLLERRALLDGERTAAVCGDERLTFCELDELAGRMAAFLAERGVARGGTVAALLRNGIAFCCLYHAAARLGAVLCPLNWRLTARELAPMLRNCGAPLLLFDEDLAGTASPLSGLPGLRHRIPVRADGGLARLPRRLPAAPAGMPRPARRSAPDRAHLGHVGPPQGRRPEPGPDALVVAHDRGHRRCPGRRRRPDRRAHVPRRRPVVRDPVRASRRHRRARAEMGAGGNPGADRTGVDQPLLRRRDDAGRAHAVAPLRGDGSPGACAGSCREEARSRFR